MAHKQPTNQPNKQTNKTVMKIERAASVMRILHHLFLRIQPQQKLSTFFVFFVVFGLFV